VFVPRRDIGIENLHGPPGNVAPLPSRHSTGWLWELAAGMSVSGAFRSNLAEDSQSTCTRRVRIRVAPSLRDCGRVPRAHIIRLALCIRREIGSIRGRCFLENPTPAIRDPNRLRLPAPKRKGWAILYRSVTA
jgi:hypothetical protein